MEPKRISERYLIFQRIITFLDEWLFYGLLLYLFTRGHTTILPCVALLGGFFISYSYWRLWDMETRRFGYAGAIPDSLTSTEQHSQRKSPDDHYE